MNNTQIEKLISRGLLIIGIILFTITAFISYFRIEQIQSSTILPAEVVDYDRRVNSEGSVSFHPVVEYTTPHGETQGFTSGTGTNSTRLLGQEITVLYNEELPHKTRINHFVYLWLAPMITGGIGVMFTLFGIGFMMASKNGNQLEFKRTKKKSFKNRETL